jgi:hypothetical protein
MRFEAKRSVVWCSPPMTQYAPFGSMRSDQTMNGSVFEEFEFVVIDWEVPFGVENSAGSSFPAQHLVQ